MQLPAELEKEFIQDNARKMRANLQENGFNLLVLFLGFSVFLFYLIPFEDLGRYPWIILLLFAGLVVRIIDSHNPWFDPFTEIFSAIGGGGAIALVMYGMTTVSDPDFELIAKVGVTLFVFSHFTLLKLRLKMAILGIIFSLIVIYIGSILIDYQINWLQFGGYFMSPCAIGGGVCYVNEYWARTVYLQEQLLLIENKRVENLYKKVEDMSKTDYLTGLNNRRHLSEMLEHEWARGRRSRSQMAIIFIDIDYFKQYNDFYGHEAGDQTLQAVAKVLKQSALRGGDIVCRYGGEEFVVVLPDTNAEQTEEVIQRIQNTLKDEKLVHEKSQVSGFITLSMGVYVAVPGDIDEHWDDALKKADEALYQAKGQGRNRWCLAKT